jgi:hypothetical protein
MKDGDLHVAKLFYTFVSRRKSGRVFTVEIDNSVPEILLKGVGEGLDIVGIQRIDQYAYTPLDLDDATVDISQGLTLALSSHSANNKGTHDFTHSEIDMRLVRSPHGIVWHVSCEEFGSPTDGYGEVVVQAATGRIVPRDEDRASDQEAKD